MGPRLCSGIVAGAVLLTSAQAGAAELVSQVERVSASASAEGLYLSLSDDGRYAAFHSQAPNLVAGQATSSYDNVFLRDRVTGVNTLVSHVPGAPGTAGDLYSFSPVVSGDGSVVLFLSTSRNLVSGQVDPSETRDLFLYERATGNLVLVSHAASSATTAANGESFTGALVSAEGRYAAFTSYATNLIAGLTDTNETADVFLHDRVAGTTVLVSHQAGSATTAGSGASVLRGLSADGRFILLASYATDLVPSQSGLFLYDRTTGTLAAVAPGVEGDTPAGISADGNFIVILTRVNLVPGQTDPGDPQNVFLYDRQAGTFALVSHASSSATTSGNAWAFAPALSADGRWVAYLSGASDLAAGLTLPEERQLFLYDRLSGTNTLVTHSSGSPATGSNGFAFEPLALSPDGRYLAFASAATNLIAGLTDTNQHSDVFLYDRTVGSLVPASHAQAAPMTTGSGASLGPIEMSDDGRWTAFLSDAGDLVADDLDAARDVFLYDSQAGASVLVSERDPASPALTGLAESQFGDLSDDGRYVLFHSAAPFMAEGVADGNDTQDAFLRDRTTGDTVLVSESASTPGRTANAWSRGRAISADGRWAAFDSNATDLVAGQTDLYQTPDLFLWDRMTGARTLVTHTPSSPVTTANAGPGGVALSADGRYVVFVSQATNLVSGQIDAPWDSDVFVFDRTTGTSSLISHKAGAPLTAAGGCLSDVSISADGRWVAFSSTAPDLVPGLTLATTYLNVYLHDRSTGTTTLVSRAAGPGLQAGNAFSYGYSLSLDGRFLPFYGDASNLVPGQNTGNIRNVFLYDHATGSTSLVSHVPGSTTQGGNHFSQGTVVSPEGTFVIFGSLASNLVAGQVDTAGLQDLFRYDRRTGAVALVSHTPDSPATAGDGESSLLGVGADGTVAYMSRARNLVAGQVDTAGSDDVFRYDPVTGANRLLTGVLSSATETTGGLIARVGVSRNGRVALFDSRSPNLVAGDYNKAFDVFADEAPDTASDFYTVAPCRLLDTRAPGNGPLANNTVRLVTVHGACGIPPTARALAANVTVIGATGQGNLKLYPSGLIAPGTSTINFAAGQTRANNALVPLTPGVEHGLAATPLVTGGGTVHILLDVTGWFE